MHKSAAIGHSALMPDEDELSAWEAKYDASLKAESDRAAAEETKAGFASADLMAVRGYVFLVVLVVGGFVGSIALLRTSYWLFVIFGVMLFAVMAAATLSLATLFFRDGR